MYFDSMQRVYKHTFPLLLLGGVMYGPHPLERSLLSVPLMLHHHSCWWCNLDSILLQQKVGAPGLLQLTGDVSACGFSQLCAFPTLAWTHASPDAVNQTLPLQPVLLIARSKGNLCCNTCMHLGLPYWGIESCSYAFPLLGSHKYSLLIFYSFAIHLSLDLCYQEVDFAFCAPVHKPIFGRFIKLTEGRKRR